MKTIYAALATMLFLVCTDVRAFSQLPQKNNADTMNQAAEENLARNIFKTFQQRDDAMWVLLYPTNTEYRELTRLMTLAKIIKLPQATIDEMLARHDREATAAYKEIFHNFLQQSDSMGIRWKGAVYQKLEFDSFYPEDFIRKYMNGNIWFTYNNRRFVIEGIEAVEIPFGFKLQSIREIREVHDGE